MAVEIGQPGSDDGFGHCFATMATHRLALAVNDDCVMGSRRDGQAAVKAGAFGGGLDVGCEGFGGGGHGKIGTAGAFQSTIQLKPIWYSIFQSSLLIPLASNTRLVIRWQSGAERLVRIYQPLESCLHRRLNGSFFK